jgi:predicted transcriptional regulator
MAERMRRTRILFLEEEYRRLQEVAQEQKRSVGCLVREAVAKQYPENARDLIEACLV